MTTTNADLVPLHAESDTLHLAELVRRDEVSAPEPTEVAGTEDVDNATVDEGARLRRDTVESLSNAGILLDRAALQQAAEAIVSSRHVNIVRAQAPTKAVAPPRVSMVTLLSSPQEQCPIFRT